MRQSGSRVGHADRWDVRVRVNLRCARSSARGVSADLRALAARMPPVVRQVFTLRKVYELSPRQIAATLGLSDQEVEQCLITAALACAAGVRRCVSPEPPTTSPAAGAPSAGPTADP